MTNVPPDHQWWEPRRYMESNEEYIQFAKLRLAGASKPTIKTTLRINERAFLNHDLRYRCLAKKANVVIQPARSCTDEEYLEYTTFADLYNKAPITTEGRYLGKGKSRKWIREQLGGTEEREYSRLYHWCLDNKLLDK